jgi:bifunctional N-acetylglucosamine-1-phosphate-uridyltransferase/glucosamine-1-phosphate-acetyltransferase GlmU-like protein
MGNFANQEFHPGCRGENAIFLYIGDANIGKMSISALTVTCNYDGKKI